MIAAAALCPHAPLLYREVAGRVDAAAALRQACHDAVSGLAADVDRVLVVGGADVAEPTPVRPATPDVRRFGGTGPRSASVTASAPPLSLGVGLRLLDEVGWTGPVEPVAVPWSLDAGAARDLVASLSDDGRRSGLLVLGEGSTRRGQAAPGFLDERAFPFDDALAAAVERGDAQALLDLDPALCDELMVLGRAAFTVLGAAAGGRDVRAALTYRGDPFGVTYLVATWSFQPPDVVAVRDARNS